MRLKYEWTTAAFAPTTKPRYRGTVLIDEDGMIWGPNNTFTGHEKIGSGSEGGAVVSTEAAIAALQAGNTLVPGLYIDEELRASLALSSSVRRLLSESLYLGEMPLANGLATLSPVNGMSFDANNIGNQLFRIVRIGGAWRPWREQDIYSNTTYLGQTAIPASVSELLLANASIVIPPGLLGYDGAQCDVTWAVDKQHTGNGDDGTVQNDIDANTTTFRFGGTDPTSNPTTNSILAGPFTLTAASGRTQSGRIRFIRRSATTVRLIGSANAAQLNRYAGTTSGTSRPTQITVANLDSATNYLHFNATNPVAVITPQVNWVQVNSLIVRVR